MCIQTENDNVKDNNMIKKYRSCLNIYQMQGWIQDFKLGCTLKINRAEWREARKLLGHFLWKITILRKKILFFPILGGGGTINSNSKRSTVIFSYSWFYCINAYLIYSFIQHLKMFIYISINHPGIKMVKMNGHCILSTKRKEHLSVG